MSDYNARVRGLAKCGNAAGQLVGRHRQLFFSIPEEETFQKIVAVIRTDDSIEPPQTEEEAYALVESILAELLYDGRIKISKVGLSPFGKESFDFLVGLHENGRPVPSTDPKEIYKDVVNLYRTDMTSFQNRRATDPEFLRRSNEANDLHLF
jgi:hypothetical protein